MIKIKNNLDPVYKIVALKMIEYDRDEDIVIYRLTKDCGNDIIYNRRNNRYIEIPSHSYAIIESVCGIVLMSIKHDTKRKKKRLYKEYGLKAYNLSKMRFSIRQTLYNIIAFATSDSKVMRLGLSGLFTEKVN